MFIFQVVGYKNSGKTTLICNIVEKLSNSGWNVATLKHHGHGGTPEQIVEVDSEKHRRAGAMLTGVEGAGVLQLTIQQPSWNMEKMLAFYQLVDTDLLILEGFKNLDYPKVVLTREKNHLDLLDKVTNIFAAFSAVYVDPAHYPFPIYDLKEQSRPVEIILEAISKKLKKNA